MLIPIQHENMSARRWPIITLALILVNLLIFAGTHRTMDQQDSQLWKVKKHILILAATHPNLVLTPEAKEYVDGFQNQFPDDWAELQNPNSEIADEWDARTRLIEDPAELQEEMDSLGDEYLRLTASSITERYAFIASPPKADYISNFDLPSWRLVARHRQYVVPVAGRICAGGRLGPTALPTRLSGGGCIRMPV